LSVLLLHCACAAVQDLALRACLFSAVGTAGQRCTTLRRLFVHSSIHDAFLERLAAAYSTVAVGHPLYSATLCGPLHTPAGVALFRNVLERVPQEGGRIVAGGTVLTDIAGCEKGNFVQPALVSMPAQQGPLVLEENFVPVSV
jgi:acyl-CoA reductase-like NAD-dependent aldehyde dehydrogenase